MRRRVTAFALGAAALALLPAIATGSTATSAANSQSFPDAVGEDPAAPDITSVDVSNTDAGLIRFKVNVSNRPTLTGDMLFLIFMDTVQGAGDPLSLGADYALQLLPGSVGLFRWDGQDFRGAPSQEGVGYTYEQSGPAITVSAAAIGGAKTVSFAVIAMSGLVEDANGDLDFDNAATDVAPNAGGGLYTYQVLTRLVLRVEAFTQAPTPAKPGKPFAVALGVTRNDTGGNVATGSLACLATIGGRPVQVRSKRVANGVATCQFVIPRRPAGRVIRGSITLVVGGTKVSRSFATRIAAR